MAKTKITPEQLRAALVRHDGNREHAGRELGVAGGYIRSLVRDYKSAGYEFPPNAQKPSERFAAAYVPTPEEIAQRMQSIRRANGLPPIDEMRVAQSIRDGV